MNTHINPFLDKEVASFYDAFYQNPVGKVFDKWEKEAVKDLIPAERMGKGTLLDIGCGTGHWSYFFSSLGFEVLGIDISWEMINKAKKKKQSFKHSSQKASQKASQKPSNQKIRFIQGDAQNLSLDEKFDFISYITSLEFIEDPSKSIKAAYKHLKPDGYFLLGVLNSDSPLAESRKQDPVYSKGTYYSQKELERLFSSFGNTKWHQCVYLTPPKIQNISQEEAENMEKENQSRQNQNGAFIAGRVGPCK